METKSSKLFLILSAILITSALVAELIGGKIFSLEATLGIPQVDWEIANTKVNLNFTAGVLVWPVVFIITDIVNEYYGVKGVRFLSWLTAIVIAFAFILIFISIQLAPADFFKNSKIGSGIPDMNSAFQFVFGQGLNIIIASLIAFLLGQIVDAYTYRKIHRMTGPHKKWLRATGSTFVSQFLDSFVVLFIAFYIGSRVQYHQGDYIWPLSLVITLSLVNFAYKIICAIVMLPLLYFIHGLIIRYLGRDETSRLISKNLD